MSLAKVVVSQGRERRAVQADIAGRPFAHRTDSGERQAFERGRDGARRRAVNSSS